MKLVKSLLLGSAATFVAVAAAHAADLPSKKAAPVSYVKVCDAYGAGFFYLPGTETCVKIGGRVRADYAASGKQNIYATTASSAGYDTTAAARFNTIATSKTAENVYGWEARGRVDLDARTQTAWGTVQTVASLRLARTTGILDQVGPALSSASAAATLEAAYIRFAGFTFGAARDNFSFMPSTFYGAGHWSSFANGAKQLAYTAVLGGGFSATIAIQDAADTTAGGVVAAQYLDASNLRTNFGATLASPAYSYNNMPQVNGRVDFDQAWGTASVMGALGKAVGDNLTAVYDADKTVYALGAGVKFNLPMIAAGDVLYLNGAYADGMTEYTVNWTSFKSSDTKRNVGGFVVTSPSWIYTLNSAGAAGKVETLKSWNLAALYTHYWAPDWRHSFLASYGKVDGTTTSKALTWGQTGAFGDVTVWNLGTQLAWLPTRDFEIGVDVLYARVEQDLRRQNGAISGSTFTAGATTLANSTVTKEKTGNLSGRLRVERTF